jgi:tRNA G37 N-methylase Trm5
MTIKHFFENINLQSIKEKKEFIEYNYFLVSIYKMIGKDIIINQIQVRNKETDKFIDNIILQDAFKIMPYMKVSFRKI